MSGRVRGGPGSLSQAGSLGQRGQGRWHTLVVINPNYIKILKLLSWNMHANGFWNWQWRKAAVNKGIYILWLPSACRLLHVCLNVIGSVRANRSLAARLQVLVTRCVSQSNLIGVKETSLCASKEESWSRPRRSQDPPATRWGPSGQEWRLNSTFHFHTTDCMMDVGGRYTYWPVVCLWI